MTEDREIGTGAVKFDNLGSRFALSLRVKAARRLADGIVGLDLVDAASGELPPWTPGAHIDLVLPSGAIRSYSLCGDTKDGGAYRIAVLDDPHGRGASREIHSPDLVGRILPASPPRNHFELVDARHLVFIAGGIGITPIAAMARDVTARGGSWEMHYLGRSRSSMAFLDDMSALAASSGNRFNVVARDESGRVSIRDLLAAVPPGSILYCCGPERLIRDVEELTVASGQFELHVERFGRASVVELKPGLKRDHEADDSDFFDRCDTSGSFTVELRQTGHVLQVNAGQSILECARKVRTGLSFSCSDGYCGTCETAVIAGLPDHRDTVLSEEERAEGRTMMICVSRSLSRRLALDL